MNITCPKCGKTILEPAISHGAFKCPTCDEWFAARMESDFHQGAVNK
jgi:phage FluMu protein Com